MKMTMTLMITVSIFDEEGENLRTRAALQQFQLLRQQQQKFADNMYDSSQQLSPAMTTVDNTAIRTQLEASSPANQDAQPVPAEQQLNIELFIDEVEKYPCIWNIRLPSYKEQPKKKLAWQFIHQPLIIKLLLVRNLCLLVKQRFKSRISVVLIKFVQCDCFIVSVFTTVFSIISWPAVMYEFTLTVFLPFFWWITLKDSGKHYGISLEDVLLIVRPSPDLGPRVGSSPSASISRTFNFSVMSSVMQKLKAM